MDYDILNQVLRLVRVLGSVWLFGSYVTLIYRLWRRDRDELVNRSKYMITMITGLALGRLFSFIATGWGVALASPAPLGPQVYATISMLIELVGTTTFMLYIFNVINSVKPRRLVTTNDQLDALIEKLEAFIQDSQNKIVNLKRIKAEDIEYERSHGNSPK